MYLLDDNQQLNTYWSRSVEAVKESDYTSLFLVTKGHAYQAAFTTYIDQAPAIPEYKLLQL